jgi:uncharacterized membrane protein YhaH (DUF805 family)
MKKKYLIISLLNLVLTLPLRAQNNSFGDALLNGNKMYAVIAVLLVILIGIVLFLVSLERRIKKLEED